MVEVKIRELIKPEYVYMDAVSVGRDCRSALRSISRFLSKECRLDEDILLKGFLAREAIGSTGFGNGIALPHARIREDFLPLIAVVSFQADVDWHAIDGVPVKTAIAFAVPENAQEMYLDVLAAFSRRLADEEFCSRLKRIQDAQVLYRFILQEVAQCTDT